ncbi:MAG: cell surface protein SprA, partial [Bacteroidota bacterium]
DGADLEEERSFFAPQYLDRISAQFGPVSPAYQTALEDPSHDNFNYFRDSEYDDQELNILERYKEFNGMEGNSPASDQGASDDAGNFIPSATTLPNDEDINRDNTLDVSESYWQYKVNINPSEINPGNVGRNYITDVRTTEARTEDGSLRPVRWYQFKIPLRGPEAQAINNIRDFRSIRFMRIFMRGFRTPVYLRFARLELVRGEWRKFEGDLSGPGDYITEDEFSEFDISAVNIEENASKFPVNYVLPPEIDREINIGTTNLQRLNEQSLAMDICDLDDGAARAAFRNVPDLDMLSYKKLRMFVHAEAAGDQVLNDDDLVLFLRLGTDFNENYYEYEVPLKVTPPGDYDNGSNQQRALVWPEENEVFINFDDLRFASDNGASN